MEPDTYTEKLLKWLKGSTTIGNQRQQYIDELTEKLIKKQQQDMMTNTVNPASVITPADIEEAFKQIDEINKRMEEPVIETPVFDDGEKAKFIALKTAARVSMYEFFGCEPLPIIKDNLVIAGSVFVDWWYGKPPKDIDCFILSNDLAQQTMRQILTEKGYKPKDVEYLKNKSKGARRVQEVWESNLKIDEWLKEKKGYVYQIIFTDCKTRKELLEDFDFKHCCVSYHNEKLHITRNICDAIKEKRLIINNDKNIMPWRVEKFKSRGFTDPSEAYITLGEIFTRAVENLKEHNARLSASVPATWTT